MVICGAEITGEGVSMADAWGNLSFLGTSRGSFEGEYHSIIPMDEPVEVYRDRVALYE
jgi:hypothetical protein